MLAKGALDQPCFGCWQHRCSFGCHLAGFARPGHLILRHSLVTLEVYQGTHLVRRTQQAFIWLDSVNFEPTRFGQHSYGPGVSTTSRLYLGVFGLLMFPVLSAAIIGFVLCFVAAPPVDIDGIRKPVAGSLLYGNNIVSGALIPSSNAIGSRAF